MNLQSANPCANVTMGAADTTVPTHTCGKMTKSVVNRTDFIEQHNKDFAVATR
jgi:hypothetical protein